MIKRISAIFFLALSTAVVFAGSPFSVQATRAIHDGQPAIRVSFDFPAEPHLFSSFSVSDATGNPLQPLLVPPPDTNNPDEIEPS